MLLEVRNLHVSYGDAPALWDATLEVAAGQVVAVVGPNGAGKSTLINTIAGILRARQGEIRLDGKDIAKIPGHRVCEHGIAIVPEGRRLFTHMSVLENLELGSYRSDARASGEGSLEKVFSLFPILKERRHQIAGSMSGGQQQMVAIGRALMARPRLLLMDEPSLGLSPAVVDDMFRIIRTINERGVAVLLVEQNIHKALEMAHHAYVIEQGRIVSSGKPDSLLGNPRIREAYLGV
ncbi:branched-chain amino acid ABC transporter ATP-binding protein [Variovorax sp. WS11]|uniref:ABC transporter ATP-binding protein n=1 Tax=Variovorax sp. WS11 TaxID=1105204 RepID=UPI000D0D3943|nr:ABC transporter ATP-binding protein [Variovorax sp. WS11]NDZ15700.1 ABC transporter ATP-binding protein [Variovorax sp. WS11]PSL82931.1 branched-chain amino acid ABC transporter ATP-binding protein [Variovorax sp. WS11]